MKKHKRLLFFNACYVLKVIYFVLFAIQICIFVKIFFLLWIDINVDPKKHNIILSVDEKIKNKMKVELNTELIKQQSWFGEYSLLSEDNYISTESFDTSLLSSIVLHGIAFGINSGVVLEEGGEQQVYLLGEKLRAFNAVIKEIQHDYITLQYHSKNIRIYLNKDTKSGSDVKQHDESSDKNDIFSSGTLSIADTFSSFPSHIQQELAKDPQKIFEYICFTTVYKGKDRVISVMPGDDASLFNITGLESGDLVIALNGQPLNNPEDINAIKQQVYSLNTLRLTVLRNGVRHKVSIALR